MEQQAVRQQISLAERAFRSGDAQLAERLLGQVISADPGHSKANELLAYIAGNRGDTELAFELLKKAVATSDASAEAFYYLGTVYLERKLYGEAIVVLERALQLGGDFFEGLHDLGAALAGNREYERALRAFGKAHSKNRRSYEVHYHVAKALYQLKRHGEALRYYDQALAIDPGRAEAWADRATAFGELKRHDEAFASYGRALAIKADSDYLYGNWLHAKMQLCDWSGLEDAFESLEQKIMGGHKASPPFPVLATPASLAAQRKCAEIFVQDQFPACAGAEFDVGPSEPERLKIGYFSADFYSHATSYLMVELLERHDRSKFEVVGFSFGPPAEDEMRKRVESACDRFFDVRAQPDRQIAQLSRSLGVHIAVDLKGFTQDGRPGIFALRAAPVQAGYLGYPGTMGASYIDYLIADAYVIPPNKTDHYSEKIAYLPDSYQVNGSGRKGSDRIFTRAELGLPQTGFVFACLNNHYKITPDLFDIWMRLLSGVPNSVLWLFEGNKTTGSNLRNEARKRGVPAERLIFAGRLNPAEHLARYRAADLFLDTFHYNAHTTASDALWAGLPVLTCPGETFAARVSGSLLNAIGLPELITQSPAQYEALALELATRPGKLAALKAKLAQNKLSYPLFDTARFTRNIEGVYLKMWQMHLSGFPPEHIG